MENRVTLVQNKQKLNDINAYLLIAFAFVLPLTVAVGNIIAVAIVIIWLRRGTFKDDWNELKDNKVILAVLGFYLLHIVGLLWTEDLQWGLHILKKETKFLLLPIFMLFVRREHIKYYIYAFLLAMSLSEVLSYAIWFEVIPGFKYASISNPTPFMSHVTYNPFLAIAIYLILSSILFKDNLNNKQKFIYLLFVITMSINMFITGGRAGQVMYFVMIGIIIFQYFNRQIMKSFLFIIIIVPLIFGLAYNTSKLFNKRVNDAITNFTNYDKIDIMRKDFEKNKVTSVGERLTFTYNSFEIAQNNILMGVGTGDFKSEYKIINQKNSPVFENAHHPHNMYMLELVQFGLIGFFSLVFILLFQIQIACRKKEKLIKYLGITLPLLFSVIMLSDSYLLGHYTSMLFIFFSAFLYKDYSYGKSNLNKEDSK